MVPKERAPAEASKALGTLVEQHVDPLLEWNAGTVEGAVKAWADGTGWAAKDAFMAVRVAVTGRSATPPLFETMAVLGTEVCRRRLRRAAEMLKGLKGSPVP